MKRFSIVSFFFVFLVTATGWVMTTAANQATGGQGKSEAEESPKSGSIKKLVLPLRVAAVISTTATAVVWSKYHATHDDYMNAEKLDKISTYYNQSNKYYKLRNGFIVATGLLWTANLVTLFLNPPPEEADEFAFIPEPGKISNAVSARWRIYYSVENSLTLSWYSVF